MDSPMSMEHASIPKLPEEYRPIPIGRVVLWVWAITATILLALFSIMGILTLNAITSTGDGLGAFVGEAGCSAYWSFVLDAKNSGLALTQVESMYLELGASGNMSALSTCGNVSEIFARFE